MNIKKIALTAGLAGTLSGCCGYYATGTYVVPTSGSYIAPTTYVAPTVVTPTVVVPAFRPYWWGPHFHHHHHWRGRW